MRKNPFLFMSPAAALALLACGAQWTRAQDDGESMTSEAVEQIIAEELGVTTEPAEPAPQPEPQIVLPPPVTPNALPPRPPRPPDAQPPRAPEPVAPPAAVQRPIAPPVRPAAPAVRQAPPVERPPVAAPARPPAPLAAQADAKASEEKLQQAQAEIARLEGVVRQLSDVRSQEEANKHYNMGCVYKASKMYNEAEAEFLKALKLNPNDPYLHYNLGILYEDDLNKPAKAREHYEAFLELAPNDRDATNVKEWLLSLP